MTLNEWRTDNRLYWHEVAIQLTAQGNGPIYEGRLNRLRRGKTPTPAELAALLFMTDGDVDTFKDEL